MRPRRGALSWTEESMYNRLCELPGSPFPAGSFPDGAVGKLLLEISVVDSVLQRFFRIRQPLPAGANGRVALDHISLDRDCAGVDYCDGYVERHEIPGQGVIWVSWAGSASGGIARSSYCRNGSAGLGTGLDPAGRSLNLWVVLKESQDQP